MSHKTGFYEGRLGIGLANDGGDGTGNPRFPLDVNGDIRLTGAILKANGEKYLGGLTKMGMNNMTELQNGNIGVGTETPTVLFDISGNTKISGDLNIIGTLQMNGQTPTYSNWSNSGDDIFRDSKVTIGQNSVNTSYKLYVNGNTHINGTLSATTLSGNLAWSNITSKPTTITTTQASNITTNNAKVSSQWVTGSSSKIYYNSGNVGIGRADPQTLLHICNDGGDALLRIQTETGNTNLAGIEFWTDDTTSSSGASYPATRILSSFTGTTYDSAYLKFQTHHSNLTTYNDTMIIKGPNVGIGTTDPKDKLHVKDGNIIIDKEWGYICWGNDTNTMAAVRAGTLNGIKVVQIMQAGAPTMTIKSSNVGIGTTSPNANLHIRNDTDTTGTGDAFIPSLSGNDNNRKPTECLRLQGTYNDSGSGALIRFTNYHASGSNPSNDEYNLAGIAGYDVKSDWGGGLCLYTAPSTSTGGNLTARMVIDNVGNVGIGTTSPLYPLDIGTHAMPYYAGGIGTEEYTNNSFTAGSAYNWDGNYHATYIFSARFAGGIAVMGNYIVLASDTRIKQNIVDVPDNLALETLRSIPVRYYEYIDKLERGSNKTIGFIAQEVKEHLPEAVVFSYKIIPNEMRMLENTLWEEIIDGSNNKYKLTTDLSNCSGIKYRFYVSNDISGNDEVMKEVVGNSDNTFTFDEHWNNVFCYGKEVDDFHTLDKNKLYTINFSATQELDRKVTALENENAELKAELAAIKAHLGI